MDHWIVARQTVDRLVYFANNNNSNNHNKLQSCFAYRFITI